MGRVYVLKPSIRSPSEQGSPFLILGFRTLVGARNSGVARQPGIYASKTRSSHAPGLKNSR